MVSDVPQVKEEQMARICLYVCDILQGARASLLMPLKNVSYTDRQTEQKLSMCTNYILRIQEMK